MLTIRPVIARGLSMLLCILLASVSTLAALEVNTWTDNGGDSRWGNPANWSLQAVPTSEHRVQYNDVATTEILVDVDATVGAIEWTDWEIDAPRLRIVSSVTLTVLGEFILKQAIGDDPALPETYSVFIEADARMALEGRLWARHGQPAIRGPGSIRLNGESAILDIGGYVIWASETAVNPLRVFTPVEFVRGRIQGTSDEPAEGEGFTPLSGTLSVAVDGQGSLQPGKVFAEGDSDSPANSFIMLNDGVLSRSLRLELDSNSDNAIEAFYESEYLRIQGTINLGGARVVMNDVGSDFITPDVGARVRVVLNEGDNGNYQGQISDPFGRLRTASDNQYWWTVTNGAVILADTLYETDAVVLEVHDTMYRLQASNSGPLEWHNTSWSSSDDHSGGPNLDTTAVVGGAGDLSVPLITVDNGGAEPDFTGSLVLNPGNVSGDPTQLAIAEDASLTIGSVFAWRGGSLIGPGTLQAQDLTRGFDLAVTNASEDDLPTFRDGIQIINTASATGSQGTVVFDGNMFYAGAGNVLRADRLDVSSDSGISQVDEGEPSLLLDFNRVEIFRSETLSFDTGVSLEISERADIAGRIVGSGPITLATGGTWHFVPNIGASVQGNLSINGTMTGQGSVTGTLSLGPDAVLQPTGNANNFVTLSLGRLEGPDSGLATLRLAIGNDSSQVGQLSLGSTASDLSAIQLQMDAAVSIDAAQGARWQIVSAQADPGIFQGLADGSMIDVGDDQLRVDYREESAGQFQVFLTKPVLAPTVTGPAQTNELRPTWEWTSSGGGQGYRSQLNNPEFSAAITTTETSFTPTADLAEGTHTLYVQELGLNGIWSDNGSFTVTIDTTPPAAPTVSVDSPTNNPQPTWSWVGGGGGNGIFRVAGSEDELAAAAETTGTSYTPPEPLEDGSYLLFVQERDDAGNWSPVGSAEVLIDSTAPGVPTVTVAEGSPTNTQRPTWSWISGGWGNGVYRFAFSEDQLSSALEVEVTTFSPDENLPEGSHTLYVQERNDAGTWSGVGLASIVVDVTPPNAPTVSVTSPTTNLRPTWSWISGGGDGNGIFRAALDGDPLSEAPSSSATSFTPATDLAIGSHTLYVQERDEAGNWSLFGSAQVIIEGVEAEPPAWADTYPAADTITFDRFRLRALVDQDATVYVVLVAAGATPPSAEQIIAAQGGDGEPAPVSRAFAVNADAETTTFIDFPDQGTDYQLYAVARNADELYSADPQVLELRSRVRVVLDGIDDLLTVSGGVTRYNSIAPGTFEGWTNLLNALQGRSERQVRAFIWDAANQSYRQLPIARDEIPLEAAVFIATRVNLGLNFTGSASESPLRIGLSPGWNFIGIPPVERDGVVETDHPIVDLSYEDADGAFIEGDFPIRRYVATTGSYVDVTEGSLRSGQGYWVYNAFEFTVYLRRELSEEAVTFVPQRSWLVGQP